MAILRFAGCFLTCVAADTKPTGPYLANWRALETDTGKLFYTSDGTTWNETTGADKTETLTNKTISGSSNTFSNIGKTALPATTVFTDQANTFGAFAQTFPSSQLLVQNPAATFSYIVAGSAITANRTATIPLLAGNDQFTMDAFATTVTNKTFNVTNNTLTDTSAATGDILKHNGTKFIKLTMGSANQVLTVNAGGTDVAWAAATGGGVSTSAVNTWSAVQTFLDTDFVLRNPANTFSSTISAGAQTASNTFTFPVTASDVITTIAATQTLTNKTIAAGSNTITGIADANITAHTTTKITTTSKSLLNSSIAYIDQANVFGSFTNEFTGAVQQDLYQDIKTVTIPSAPATNYVRVYAKAIDASNYGLYAQSLEAGSNNEIRIF